jgi:hypothetical protein
MPDSSSEAADITPDHPGYLSTISSIVTPKEKAGKTFPAFTVLEGREVRPRPAG